MTPFLSTKEVAKYLCVNEKMVYTLVAEKRLPATKITGKWLFPKHLVDQWIEANTINFPDFPAASAASSLVVIAGSNDPLIERTIQLFNTHQSDYLAVFGNLGSLGGLRALRRNLCHVATSHLMQDTDAGEYNFDYAARELEKQPAVVNFCLREQGLIVAAGNPKAVSGPKDLAKGGFRLVNRPVGTGTRLLLDRELKSAGVNTASIAGYEHEVSRHMDVGIEVLSGRADVGPGIRAVADLLGLDFIPLRWERYDLLIVKERFFDPGIQRFLGFLHEPVFRDAAASFAGYDIERAGKMIFPGRD
ncbi:MAG: substrate-binding domain-containing protein [Desulfobacterales bacterium]